MAVVIIDRAAHAHAADWYGSRPSEPSGAGVSLSADTVLPLSGLTLDGVLTEIAARASRSGDVMIVCHARAEGLALPLIQGGQERARFGLLGSLSAATESDGIPMPAMPLGEAASTLMMSEAQVDSLRQKATLVRGLGLRHVALRGCNVGSWANGLETYRDFFGCRSISGPSLRDTYGIVTPDVVPDFTPWLRRHHGWHTFVEGPAGSQVAVATQGGQTDEHSYEIRVAAQTPAALAEWGTRHLGSAPIGTFFYHGMFQTHAAPDSPRIHFVHDTEYTARLRVIR